MTDRRSMQADAARSSRAFQFVPGHVGGRVASAQPVRRRRTVGGLTKPPGVTPATVAISTGLGASATVAPADVTAAAIMFLHAGYDATATPPAGFTRIDADTFGPASTPVGPLTWQVVTAGPVAEGTVPTFTLGGAVGGWSQVEEWVVVYFIGGTGGSLSVERGPHYPSTSYAEFNDAPPSGAESWIYLGALKGVYNNPTTNVSGLTNSNGLIGIYAYPGVGSHAAPATTLPSSAYLDWDSLGAYGIPGSQALCLGWTP